MGFNKVTKSALKLFEKFIFLFFLVKGSCCANCGIIYHKIVGDFTVKIEFTNVKIIKQ